MLIILSSPDFVSDRSVMSSADTVHGTEIPCKDNPRFEDSSSRISPSMKQRYSQGELTPPCLVPIFFFYTYKLCMKYQEQKSTK